MFKVAGRITFLVKTEKNVFVGHFETMSQAINSV